VQAYIAAMPGWKRELGELLDELIMRAVPQARKAVKYNEPFYGVDPESDVWFVSFRCFTKYLKLTFFSGTSLDPQPPKGSKVPNVRYFEIFEDDEVDEELLTSWFTQASQLPGEKI
ncbi:MAG: DUF1801 domain-containing protein, partial [Acidimicrobiales bacterium]|nr:DUF1801 domain-containing protein [Acidimicrobiales bacterium]